MIEETNTKFFKAFMKDVHETTDKMLFFEETGKLYLYIETYLTVNLDNCVKKNQSMAVIISYTWGLI